MSDLSDASRLLKALSAKNDQFLRLFFPRDDGPKATLIVEELHASESLSSDFHFRVSVISDDASISLKDVLGKMVTVELAREDGTHRYFNGYVFEFRFVDASSSFARYDMVLMPWLAFLRRRTDNYLFHFKSLRKITEDTFNDYGKWADFKFDIRNDDPEFTDACQFAETDYNHLHRRWEALGWHYWYEHRADGHKLVLSDDSTAAQPIAGSSPVIEFYADKEHIRSDGLNSWASVRQPIPNRFAVTGYDFKLPRTHDVRQRSAYEQGDLPDLEVYEYMGAYGFKNVGDGEAMVRRRMEEAEALGKHFNARGNSRFVELRRWFRLGADVDKSLGASDSDREFLVVALTHTASNNYLLGTTGAEAHYESSLTCVRKRIPWRPGRGYNSEDTKIYGLQTATVVGPKGEEIHTDEYGRIRVQFHWDREGKQDEKSSAWVRLASTWAGKNFGFISLPRIGQEVIVQFIDGNPDRPLITGSVYNADHMPPWGLPGNKTQSGVLTRSTQGGSYDNANAIRFEDKKGAEQLWLHAEKDQLTEVEHDEDKWVGNDRRKTIDGNETTVVHKNRTETVDLDETITVHQNRTERVDLDEKISIGKNRSEDVELNEHIEIGQNRTEFVGANETLTVQANRTETINGAQTETIKKTCTQTVALAKMSNVGLGYSINVGAAMNTLVGGFKAEQVGLYRRIDVLGGNFTESVPSGSKTITTGKNIEFKAGDAIRLVVGKASLTMTSDGKVTIVGSEFLFDASGPVQINGKDIDLN